MLLTSNRKTVGHFSVLKYFWSIKPWFLKTKIQKRN